MSWAAVRASFLFPMFSWQHPAAPGHWLIVIVLIVPDGADDGAATGALAYRRDHPPRDAARYVGAGGGGKPPPLDLRRLGVEAGDAVRVATRRGAIELKARSDGAVPEGVVFVPFCYAEAAANALTNPALDPIGKIPEFKYCAARVEVVRVDRSGTTQVRQYEQTDYGVNDM